MAEIPKTSTHTVSIQAKMQINPETQIQQDKLRRIIVKTAFRSAPYIAVQIHLTVITLVLVLMLLRVIGWH
jgi:hypothetical protein